MPATTAPAEAKTVLRLAPDQVSLFSLMLQRGVKVPAVTGCTLRELLCDQFGIPADYVTGRITTLFLDNKPVDDMDRAVIREGSRVTLSAAMPGLVGAVMRRSGFYAALRQGISHAEENAPVGAARGTVQLKLFNLLLPELSPLILARGILIGERELTELQELLPGVEFSGSTDTVLLSVRFEAAEGEQP